MFQDKEVDSFILVLLNVPIYNMFCKIFIALDLIKNFFPKDIWILFPDRLWCIQSAILYLLCIYLVERCFASLLIMPCFYVTYVISYLLYISCHFGVLLWAWNFPSVRFFFLYKSYSFIEITFVIIRRSTPALQSSFDRGVSNLIYSGMLSFHTGWCLKTVLCLANHWKIHWILH